MEDSTNEFSDLFAGSAPNGLPGDVLAELQSISRLHSLSPSELFYKWESYCLKMGAEETVLNLDSARALKRDVQDSVERESRKTHMRGSEKRSNASATPRAFGNNRDVFGMLDNLVPNTPQDKSMKRKSAFETPGPPKTGRSADFSSPAGVETPRSTLNGDKSGNLHSTPFSQRQNSGQVLETINSHLSSPEVPIAPYPEPRIKLTANTDIKKFAYKPMAMRLSEASEVLDDRIDEFIAVFQKHHGLDDSAFGNAASQSTKEIIAVGRIASDSLEGKLNNASLVLETSRRTGAGLRVPLKIDSLASAQFFPGQIVALRGINASREYFSVTEVLDVPLLPTPISSPAAINSINERLETNGSSPLNVLLASGPYTADDNLDFDPLKALCAKATEDCVDTLVLTGPFVDLDHPIIASGDFDLPEIHGLDPDTATLSTLFRCCVTPPLHQLAMAVPSITLILCPSVRDAANKHVSWPQEMMRKGELGLPKQAKMVPNPVTLSLNESVFGLCAHDSLYDLKREEVLSGKPAEGNILNRLPRYLVEQRHFSPVFPPTAREHLPKSGVEGGLPTGSMMDVKYLKLGEWWNVRPDVLITPSVLPPFVKVIESVLIINPGTLSKRKGPGTFAQMALHPRKLTDDEQNNEHVRHKIYERAKVDIIRI